MSYSIYLEPPVDLDARHITLDFGYCGNQLSAAFHNEKHIKLLHASFAGETLDLLADAIDSLEHNYDFDAPELWQKARCGLLRMYFYASRHLDWTWEIII